jgi:hypothetical protein
MERLRRRTAKNAKDAKKRVSWGWTRMIGGAEKRMAKATFGKAREWAWENDVDLFALPGVSRV